MTTSLQPLASAIPTSGSDSSTRTLQEEQARIRVKAQKKQRKLDRLLFFFGWCEGCRSMGGGF